MVHYAGQNSFVFLALGNIWCNRIKKNTLIKLMTEANEAKEIHAYMSTGKKNGKNVTHKETI